MQIVDDGVRIGPGPQPLDALAVLEEGPDADADRFHRTADILDTGCMGRQTIRLRKDQQAPRRDRNGVVDPRVFVSEGKHLRPQLQPAARQITRGDLVFAHHKRFEVAGEVDAAPSGAGTG